MAASFGSHYPYLLQPTTASDADGLAPDIPLPAEVTEALPCPVTPPPPDIKPPPRLRSPPTEDVSPAGADTGAPRRDDLMEDLEDSKALCERRLELRSEPLPYPGEGGSGAAVLSAEPAASAALQTQEDHGCCPSPYRTNACTGDVEVKTELRSVQAGSPLGDYQSTTAQHCHADIRKEQEEEMTEGESCYFEAVKLECQSVGGDTVTCAPSSTRDEDFEHFEARQELLHFRGPEGKMDDPMAGMNALVAAVELPQACSLAVEPSLPSLPSGLPLPSDLNMAETSSLIGIALLSEIAELELERRRSSEISRRESGFRFPLSGISPFLTGGVGEGKR